MKKASEITEKVVIKYPDHVFEPVEVLNFALHPLFVREWKQLGLDYDDEMMVRTAIAAGPRMWPIIPGTGGLRKGRFSPRHSNRGKSAGIRVCYAYFADAGIVLLVSAYPKNQKENLSRRACNQIKRELKKFGESLEWGPLK